MAGQAHPRKKKKEDQPLRRCIVSSEELPKDKMIRFVVGPDHQVVADIEARLPGRGFWLSARRDVINTACDKNRFAKAARAKIKVPSDLADRVEGLLARRCLDLIGLARRAGQAVSGFEKVETWLKSGKPAGVLLAAVDGAEDGRAKVRSWAGKSPVIVALTGDELGQAFARERAVHVVLAPGQLANKLLVNAGRLEGLRNIGVSSPQD
ncbi:MAG: RNA-binding protein [Rhodospirillales bacterium]|nr:RNA-binding protein [Rhodospirillales bacterium]